MTERMLRAAGVHVQIAGRATSLLADVDLAVRPGTFHALVGPNGAGKSTLLGVLAGDIGPSAGAVTLDGTPLDRLGSRALARRRAVLLQQNTVSFAFRAREVVAMGRAPWQGSAAASEDDDVIAEALAATDVTHLADRVVTSLSGGERARVGLARVLAQRADVLLLDEPTAALDLRHQEDVLRIARDRARAGDAVVVVLHDLNAALAYADTVTLLAAGRVVATGSAADVLTPERVSEVYGQPVDRLTNAAGMPVLVPRRR